MKYLNIVAVLFMALFAVSCAERQYTVATDRNLDENIDFAQFQSFTWADQINDKEQNDFFMQNGELKDNIKDAVMHEMKARGYEMKEGEGDLVVNFRVIDEPTEITGQTETDRGYWGATQATGVDNQVVHQLEKGSILVQMIDRESGQMVWQGHATGITNEENIDNKNIRQAVSLIFDQFQFRADDL